LPGIGHLAARDDGVDVTGELGAGIFAKVMASTESTSEAVRLAIEESSMVMYALRWRTGVATAN